MAKYAMASPTQASSDVGNRKYILTTQMDTFAYCIDVFSSPYRSLLPLYLHYWLASLVTYLVIANVCSFSQLRACGIPISYLGLRLAMNSMV